MKDAIHVSKENYLKAILEADAEGHQVIPAMLAHWLEVSAPAVTMALKRLKRDGYVEVDADGASVAELAALPLVRPETAASWLTEADDRTVLRGVLAAHHLGDPGLLDRVEACRDHARPAIAEAASRSADALRRAMESRTPEEGAARQAQARTRAMASLAVLEEQLEPLLRGLGRDADGRIAAGLRPVPDDYGLAFLPQYAEAACKAYEPIWEKEPRVRPVPSNAVVRCHVAPAGMLGHDNELSFHFPGGYRHVAQLLDPHRVWARWTYLRPGASAGQSYDGLVWLDDHWAWFPKPFRALRALVVDDHPPS